MGPPPSRIRVSGLKGVRVVSLHLNPTRSMLCLFEFWVSSVGLSTYPVIWYVMWCNGNMFAFPCIYHYPLMVTGKPDPDSFEHPTTDVSC